ncbi:hypothetical protein Tco_0502150 [Tanacetum coccineum]
MQRILEYCFRTQAKPLIKDDKRALLWIWTLSRTCYAFVTKLPGHTFCLILHLKKNSCCHDENSLDILEPSNYLITPAMKESEAFKTYYAFATGKATPKPKYVRRTSKDKTEQAPKRQLKGASLDKKSNLLGIRDLSLNSQCDMKELVLKQGFRMYQIGLMKRKYLRKNSSDDDDDNELNTMMKKRKEEESSDLRVYTTFSNLNLRDNEANVDVLTRLKALEQGFSELIQTNQYATALSSIPNIVENYLGSKLKEAVDVAVQLKSDRIREEAQAKNEDFFNKVDENMKKIIKEQVNAQVKKKIDKILPRIEKLVNEQLESEVLIRSSNEAKTSHAVAANLSELELKKILIDKMKSNKSIDRSDEQKNLYKALVDAYEADKALLDTYGDTVTIKRRRDNADDDQEPSAGTDRGSKRKREGKEPESSSAPREKTSTITDKSTEGSKLHQQSFG